MKSFEEIEKHHKINIAERRGNLIVGTFHFNCGEFGSLVIGKDEDGLDHASVAPFSQRHVPTWDMMCEVKDAIWGEDEEVYEIHPPKDEYVNIKQNCLHLWARTDGKRIKEV